MRVRPTSFVRVVLTALAAVLLAPAALAQTSAGRQPAAVEAQTAEATREQLMELLRRYPTGVAHIVRLDPTLLGNDVYIGPYPGLVEFLKQHPEVRRNPEYFLQGVQVLTSPPRSVRTQAQSMWMDMMVGLFVLALLLTGVAALGWVIRTFVDYRRWNRLSKLQSEAHAKILDRLTQNDDLMAYISSPAGTHFLQSMPIMLDPARKALGAPFARILWSIQAGVVLVATGIGLQYVSGSAHEDVVNLIYSTGVVTTAVGGGFIVAALVSYVLSRRFGLLDPPAAPATGGPLSGQDA